MAVILTGRNHDKGRRRRDEKLERHQLASIYPGVNLFSPRPKRVALSRHLKKSLAYSCEITTTFMSVRQLGAQQDMYGSVVETRMFAMTSV